MRYIVKLLDRDLDITSKVRSIQIKESIRSTPHGTARIRAEYKHEENVFKAGEFIKIETDEEGGMKGRFFGVIRTVSHSIKYNNKGILQSIFSLNCVSWDYLLTVAEYKQTLSRDVGRVSEVDEGAIAKVADFNSGILSALRENLSLKDDNPLNMIESFLDKLAYYGYKDYALGHFIFYYDGGKSIFNYYGGETADQIKGVILTQFKGAYANNITHWDIVNQLFNTFPQLFELFCFSIPLSATERKTPLEKEVGVRPAIMYRYKPCNPYFPPTELRKYAKQKDILFDESQYRSEEFFGAWNDTPTGRVFEIDKGVVTELNYSFDDSNHVNLVFIENPFANGDGHKRNMFRNRTAPILDPDDINKRGLRSFSATTPFVPMRGTSEAIKTKNLLAPNALAERVFHTYGLGANFCTGSFTVQVLNGSTNTYIKAGNWVNIEGFTCYVTDVSRIYDMGVDGIHRISYIYSYIRGSFENEIAFYKKSDITEENPSSDRPTNKKK